MKLIETNTYARVQFRSVARTICEIKLDILKCTGVRYSQIAKWYKFQVLVHLTSKIASTLERFHSYNYVFGLIKAVKLSNADEPLFISFLHFQHTVYWIWSGI